MSSEINVANIVPVDTGEFMVLQDNQPIWYNLSEQEQNFLKKFVHDGSLNFFQQKEPIFVEKANEIANSYLTALRLGQFQGTFSVYLKKTSIVCPKSMPIGLYLQ
jgi:hypothetical protein